MSEIDVPRDEAFADYRRKLSFRRSSFARTRASDVTRTTFSDDPRGFYEPEAADGLDTSHVAVQALSAGRDW